MQMVSVTLAGIFLPFFSKHGYWSMFFLFAGFTVMYFVVAEFCLPETKGKTLEEIEAQFEGRAASYSIFGITVDRKHTVQVAFSSRKSHFARLSKSLR